MTGLVIPGVVMTTALTRAATREGGARVREPRSMADAAMERYAEGDGAAGARLYDLLRPRLYAIGYRWTRSASAAEDLVQDTFVKLTEARGTFQEGGRVLPWACTIARHLLSDGHRRRTTERWLLEESLRWASAGPEGSGPDDEGPDLVRLEAVVAEAVEALPPAWREPFRLVRFEHRSVRQVARQLGLTEGAVKIRTFRAATAVRATIQRWRRRA